MSEDITEKSFHHLTLLCFIAITFAPPQYYFSKGEFCAGNTNTTHQAIQFHCVRETTLSNTSDYTKWSIINRHLFFKEDLEKWRISFFTCLKVREELETENTD